MRRHLTSAFASSVCSHFQLVTYQSLVRTPWYHFLTYFETTLIVSFFNRQGSPIELCRTPVTSEIDVMRSMKTIYSDRRRDGLINNWGKIVGKTGLYCRKTTAGRVFKPIMIFPYLKQVVHVPKLNQM